MGEVPGKIRGFVLKMEQKVANVSLHRPKRTGYAWENRVTLFRIWNILAPVWRRKSPYQTSLWVATRHILLYRSIFPPWLRALAAQRGILLGLPTQSFSDSSAVRKVKDTLCLLCLGVHNT